MKARSSLPVQQHNTEILRNREAWERKPVLREIYHNFYQQIAQRIDRTKPGIIVELGSGLGAIKDVIPHCVTTDLFPNPWLDRQENAYALTFGDGSVSNLILFDVWHHLRYPGTALSEFRRVLAPGGRLILFEPAASWMGRWIYRLFHHEPVGLWGKVTWNAPHDFRPENVDYYAAQGAATRAFWWKEAQDRLGGWHLSETAPIVSFEYFASGGFSGPQFAGKRLTTLLRKLDRAGPLPRLFAARLLVVLKKEA